MAYAGVIDELYDEIDELEDELAFVDEEDMLVSTAIHMSNSTVAAQQPPRSSKPRLLE
jgi:hypothetical protein